MADDGEGHLPQPLSGQPGLLPADLAERPVVR